MTDLRLLLNDGTVTDIYAFEGPHVARVRGDYFVIYNTDTFMVDCVAKFMIRGSVKLTYTWFRTAYEFHQFKNPHLAIQHTREEIIPSLSDVSKVFPELKMKPIETMHYYKDVFHAW